MKHDSLGKIVKRELVRAMLERTQSMNMMNMMNAFGASEPAVYEDVEDTLNVAYVNRDEVALAMDIFKPKAAGAGSSAAAKRAAKRPDETKIDGWCMLALLFVAP